MLKLKKYRNIIILVVICGCIITGTIGAYAEMPYSTYTYNYFRKTVDSPHAYVPSEIVYFDNIVEGGLNDPTEIYVDHNNYIYISDTGNNRILKVNSKLELIEKYEFFENNEVEGSKDFFNKPMGVFVNNNNEIYITDSENSRIVILDETGNLVKIIPAPKSDLLSESFVYKPSAVAVDKSGRIYVIAQTCSNGIIALNADGKFEGFVGAQKVVPSFDLYWKKLMSDEQKKRINKFVPTEYNNLTIDEYGFLYVTINSIQEEKLVESIKKRNPEPGGEEKKYTSVKRLNPSGSDVLTTNGFFIPAGDVDVIASEYADKEKDGPSLIINIALKENGIYSLLDSKRNRIFTYDNEGRLLYAFAGKGVQEGLFIRPTSLKYVGSDLWVLDQNKNTITILERTKYGELIDKAINLYHDRKYEEAYTIWQELYKYNSNNEIVYLNMGRVLLRQGKYKDAMACFKSAYSTENYSKAFKLYRKEVIRKFIFLIPIIFFILVYLILRFFKYAKKVNKEAISRTDHLSLKDELLYACYYIFHPFDGAWDLKHEKRGSIRASIVIIGLVLIAKTLKISITGFIFNPSQIFLEYGIKREITTVLLTFFLWCIANWCLTTLMDGEGTFKNIFIVTSYSLVPIVLLIIPSAIISNFITLEQESLLTFLNNLAVLWTLILILIGTMVTHSYSMMKNIITSICSAIGMGFITFLVLLFAMTMNKMIMFITNVYTEIIFRL